MINILTNIIFFNLFTYECTYLFNGDMDTHLIGHR